MNVLDLIIAVPLLYGAWKGFSKGLIFEVAMIAGLVAGIYLAFKFSDIAYGWMKPLIDGDERLLHIISFFVVIAVILLVFIFYARLMEAVLSVTSLNIFNKIAGALLGLIKLALAVSVIFWLIKPFEKHMNLIPAETRNGSVLYGPVLKLSTFLAPAIKDVKDVLNEKLNG
ncbi:MAG TPA: CvpA family protein [Bacteroidia bacterium]|nr:CvpA family protein [Bacteroidia bacterium]